MPSKVHMVKATVFPVVMYGCESWTIKKVECQSIHALELWCWRRLLRVPWTARRSVSPKGNQPWIFIGRTDAEAPILRPPDVKSWLIEKTLILGKTEGKRRRGQCRMRWLYSITNSTDKNLSKLWETVEDRGAWPATLHRITKSQIGFSDWTTISNGYSTAHGKMYISIVLWEP